MYNRHTITIRQLQYVLARTYDDFVDLVDPESDISKIITSKAFETSYTSKRSTEEEKKEGSSEDEHMGRHVDITRLLLFGLLYCKGTHKEKTERFWDILQQPGLEQISWEDKELTVAGTWFLEVATHWTHVWCLERAPEGTPTTGKKIRDDFKDLERVKELSDEIY